MRKIHFPKFYHNSKRAKVLLCMIFVGYTTAMTSAVYYLKTDETMAAQAQTMSVSSFLGKLSNLDGTTTSAGYDAGEIYSIDGQMIARNMAGNGGWSKLCGAPCYNGLLGSDGTAGAIHAWSPILTSANDAVNRSMRKGNSIQMTISDAAQTYAGNALSEAFPSTVCKSAAIAIVLYDGALLCAAGNNAKMQFPDDYFSEDASVLNRAHENSAMNAYAVGSLAKVLLARVLQLQNDSLSEEFSLYSPKFHDVPTVTFESTIHNFDFESESEYPLKDAAGTSYREVSFSEALQKSSNTYFLRHAAALGTPEEVFALLNQTFDFRAVQTESFLLNAIECPANRLRYFQFGQDFVTSPVRICQMFNHAISGDAYAVFDVANVMLPNGECIYRAHPMPREDLHFDVAEDDILKAAMADCFASYHIADAITAPYQEYIINKRFLAKSGTADVTPTTVNASRMLTVLDEDGQVIASACVLVNRLEKSCPQYQNLNNTLFSLLLESCCQAGILEKEETVS